MPAPPAFSSILLLILLVHQVCSDSGKDERKAEARVFDKGDLEALINNMTSNYFLVKAFIIYWIHLLFQTVGWVVGSVLWNSLIRPGVNDLDPNIPLALSSGLVNTEFSSTNIGLALGQWGFYFAFWTVLLIVFGLTSSSSRSAQTERADFDFSLPVLERAMDDLFNPHTIAKQTIINILGSVGGSVFVALLSHLPDSDLQADKKRDGDNLQYDFGANNFLRSNEIISDEYNYSHSGY